MKIAIQGHPTRGKEVIQILESLGGVNTYSLSGTCPISFYYINKNNYIKDAFGESLCNYTLYTLEEFEKEFPFKIGDLCVYYSDILNKEIVVKILGMAIENDCIMYEVGHKDITKAHSSIYRERHTLKPYKEMKEERNITLTLSKAKEWYKKGGELKEVALQAYSEEELTKIDLPKSWEEFCEDYSIKKEECYIGTCSELHILPKTDEGRDIEMDKNVCPSQKSAKAHLAMIQLEQLRNCWWDGWEPIWDISEKWCIRLWGNGFSVGITTNISRFLTFPTKEMAEEFLKCFRDLIELAKDLI